MSVIKRMVARVKSHPVSVFVVAICSVLGLVVGAQKNAMELCRWIGVCAQEPPPGTPLQQLAFRQTREFIEQSELFGMPTFKEAVSVHSETDLTIRLLSEEDTDAIIEATAAKGPENTEHFYEERLAFHTYRKQGANLVVKYDRATDSAVGFALEAASTPADCTAMDLRNFAPLQDVISFPRPICLGNATLREFFSDDSGLNLPWRIKDYPAKCWGGSSIGGASGHGSYVAVTCEYRRSAMVEPNVSYVVTVGTEGVEVASKNYDFDEREEDGDTSLSEFLQEQGDTTVDYVVLLP